eukprot:366029-Chlamydomonas_euryale.AAC.21
MLQRRLRRRAHIPLGGQLRSQRVRARGGRVSTFGGGALLSLHVSEALQHVGLFLVERRLSRARHLKELAVAFRDLLGRGRATHVGGQDIAFTRESGQQHML